MSDTINWVAFFVVAGFFIMLYVIAMELGKISKTLEQIRDKLYNSN